MMHRCDECGYRYDSTARHAVGVTLREHALSYAARLSELGDDVISAGSGRVTPTACLAVLS